MSFKSLYKLYVINDYESFNKIYKEKINSDSTLLLNLDINGYPSFFTYDSNIMSLVSKIREIDVEINNIFNNMPTECLEQFYRKSLIDELLYTNQIEGVISTRKDINDLINEIQRKMISKNRMEGIVNKYLFLSNDYSSFDNIEDIRALYDEMLYSEIKDEDSNNLPDGEIFRKSTVHVYKTGQRIVHSGVNPENKIIEYLTVALDILNNKEIDVLIRVSIFHYLFGYIHPFYDGNGRINRFISSYVLAKYFNKVIGFRLSMTINENLSQYLNAFSNTNDKRNRADISTFVYEFLDIIYKSQVETLVFAKEKLKQSEYYSGLIHKSTLSDTEKKLLNILVECSIFGNYGISKVEMQERLSKKRTTLTNILKKFKQLNLYIETQSGRFVYYKANLLTLENL